MDKPPYFQELEVGYERYKRSVHVPASLMLPFVSGKLSATQCAVVSQHIASCAPCRELESCARAFLGEEPIADQYDPTTIERIAERGMQAVRDKIRATKADPTLSLTYEGEVMLGDCLVVIEPGHKYHLGPIPGKGKYVLHIGDQAIPFELSDADLNPNPLKTPVARGGKHPTEDAHGGSERQYRFSHGNVRVTVRIRGDKNATLEIEIDT